MRIVADNLQVMNPEIAEALETMDPQPIQALAGRCLKAGAQALDINSGPLRRAPRERFAFFVETVQAIASCPLLLDTTNAEAMRAGLQVSRSRPIINGFSLEPHKAKTILPLAREFDTDIIGYLLHPDSRVPIEADTLMTIALDLFTMFTRTGMPPERLIIDPVITPVTWDQGIQHNRAVLAVLRQLPELLGFPVRTIAGLSNLASGLSSLERKIALEAAFLPMLAAAGLDMVLMNCLHTSCVRLARICDSLLSDRVLTWAEVDL